jgi:hypothetical protein
MAIMPMPCVNELKSVTVTQAAAFQCLNFTIRISKQILTESNLLLSDTGKYGEPGHLVPRQPETRKRRLQE